MSASDAPRRVLLRAIVGALVGGAAASALWVGVEAVRVGQLVGFVAAMAATAYSGGILALIHLPIGAAVGLAVRHPRVGGVVWRRIDAEGPRCAAIVLSAGCFCAALSFSVFGLIAAFARLFGSEEVRAIALAVAVAPLAMLLLVGARWLAARSVPVFERAPSWARSPAAVVGVAGVLLVGWLLSFFLLAPQFTDELDVARRWPVVLTSVGALVGGPTIGFSRRAQIATGPWALMVAVFAVVHVARPEREAVLAAVSQRAPVSWLVREWTTVRRASVQSSSRGLADGSATCWPGKPAWSVDAVGAVRKGAPDIVFITVDSLRWDRTNLAKHDRETTPRLAEHAKAGAVFHGYTPASSTRQTFRALFTGLYPSLVKAPKTHKWALSLPPGQPTLAGFLAAGGYQTVALVSKTRLFPVEDGALQGFDVVDDSPAKVHKKTRISVAFKVDRIIARLSDPKREAKPLFVWTHFFEPHQPYEAGPAPEDFGRDEPDRYDAAVRFVDGELGRLLAFAQGPTRRGRTMVVLSADHGQAFNEHGNRFHGSTTYEEEVHVPLVFWGPGVKPTRHPTRVALLDVVPTLLDYAGLEVPPALCGRSLVPSLRSGKAPDPRPIYIEQLPDDSRSYFALAMVDRNMKLVVRPRHGIRELFDLDKDPTERANLGETDATLLQKQTDALRALYASHGMDPSDYDLVD